MLGGLETPVWAGGVVTMSSLLYSAKLTLKVLKHFYFCLQKNNSAVLVFPAFPIDMPKMAFSKSSEKDGVLIGYLRVWGFLLSSLHSSDLYITGIFSVSFLKDWRIPRKLIKYIYPFLFSPGPRQAHSPCSASPDLYF